MEPDEPIEKEWKRASGSWVDFVRSGKDFYREYMNGSALKRATVGVELNAFVLKADGGISITWERV